MSSRIPLRSDYSSAGLRKFAKGCKNHRQVRRLLALAAVYDGASRSEAARLGGMDRQTLRDWVHRFNASGPEGLRDKVSSGRPALLTAEQKQAFAQVVERGPDPAVHGVVRWRRFDLQGVIEEMFGIQMAERTISTLLHELGFAKISARPQHPGQDPKAIEAFKKTSRPCWARA